MNVDRVDLIAVLFFSGPEAIVNFLIQTAVMEQIGSSVASRCPSCHRVLECDKQVAGHTVHALRRDSWEKELLEQSMGLGKTVAFTSDRA